MESRRNASDNASAVGMSLRLESALQLLLQSGHTLPTSDAKEPDYLQSVIDALVDISSKDPLTGLANRRSFEVALARELDRVARSGDPALLLTLDIDHFKRVNDGHGHGAGDEVLRRVARLLRASCRDTDHVARMGGEEFAVLLPDTSEEGAGVLAEHLLQQVRALDLDTVVPGLRVTVSMGLAVVASGSDAPDDVMLRLDQALYAAKRAGRNCLQLATTAAAASADAAAGAVDFAADHAADHTVGGGLNRVST